MKRVLTFSFLFSLFIAIVFAACGGGGGSATIGNTSTATGTGTGTVVGTSTATATSTGTGSSTGTGTGTIAVTGPKIQIGAATGATIKALLGENGGPLAAGTQVTGDYTTKLKNLGVNAIRTHDILIYYGEVVTGPGHANPGPLDMSTMYADRTKSPAAQSSYDFTLSDTHFAAIVNGGFEPFFRLGDSASLIKEPLPGERPNWEQAAVQVLKHYTQGQWNGYTAAIPEAEIWNEPDSTGFWRRSKSEYMSLYTETALALRAAFPTLRIGGAGFTQGVVADTSATGWLNTFLDSVHTAGAPLDFVSFHIYSNSVGEPASLATSLRAILDARGLTSTKIYITEWNTSTATVSTIPDKQALRAGALGASTISAQWIKMQDAPVDRLFHYRGSDPGANTPEDYGLYTGTGTAKRTAAAFQQWGTIAATQGRLAAVVSGDSNLLALAGKNANNKPVILVVNTANAASTWTPVDTSNAALAGAWQLATISDSSAGAVTTTPVFPVAIPAYGVQLLSPAP